MKLLVVSSWFPYPPDNGSRIRAYQLLRQLALRHRVTLVCLDSPRSPDDLRPLEDLTVGLQAIQLPRSTDWHSAVRGWFSPVPRHYVQTENLDVRALVHASPGRYDAAIAFQPKAGVYVADLAGTMPTVLDEMEVGLMRDLCLQSRSSWRRARYGLTWAKFVRFTRSLLQRFDASTVASSQERDHLLAMGCDVDRVTVVPNGVEVPLTVVPAKREARLIYPGSVTFSANLEAVRYFVRDVWPLVRSECPALSFWVTGATDGVYIDDLRRTGGVTFTGRLPEVDTLIAQSAACVVPLRVGGGTRLKILQAMALSTPVVSTSKGIEGLDVAPDVHVLLGDSPRAMADQVVRVVHDSGLARRIATAAKAVVRERYTWESIGRTFEGVLESALANHRTR